jgi:uncharacterized protein (DUF58 family)
MKVNPGAIGLYGFGVLLLYLAGMYFGSYLLLLFYLSLLYPVASVLLTAAAARRFRFRQSWDKGSPVKGQQFTWNLTLMNGSALPLYRVELRFRASTPLAPSEATVFRYFLKAGEEINQRVAVRFAFRGIYTIGIETVEIKDFLHLFYFSLPSEPVRFTVYPLIHELDALPAGAVGAKGSPFRRYRDVLPDYTLFSHLRDYRPGESLKHVSWKKFASRGIPLIREYESVYTNSVKIYLDLRLPDSAGNESMTPADKLTMEDTSVELLVSLVHSLLNRGISTSVAAPGSEPFRFFGSRPEHFRDLYGATLGIGFHQTYSPARLQQNELRDMAGAGTTIFITHRADGEMQAAVERASARYGQVYLIYNRVASEADREKGAEARGGSPPRGGSLRSGRTKVIPVESASQIRGIFAR